MSATDKRPTDMDGEAKARLLARWLTDKQARDVAAMDVEGLCAITEYLVVATARSKRQAKALADHLLQRLGEEHLEYLGMEGYAEGEWVLVDANDVIVHIFQEEQRGFYNIEGLWSEARALDLAPEEGGADGAKA